MKIMIIIGKYYEIYNDKSLPSVKNNINIKLENKEIILRYMKKIKPSSSSPAIVKDVITGEKLSIPLECSNDGVFAWRSDVLYYFEKYDLRLPNDFIQYVLEKSK